MVVELEVRRFALLSGVNVRFGPGLNVFTGETGAGKSLLIDALEFLLGQSGEEGEVQGIFRPTEEARHFLASEGFEIEDELYLSRESRPGGKTISRINGTLVPAARIRSLAPYLVEIHGQHASQSLFDPRTHLVLLDAFSGEEGGALREAVAEQFRIWRDLEKRVRELSELESRRARELDLCRYELDEIEKARLKPGEEEELRDERERLSQAARLREIYLELLEMVEHVPLTKILSCLEKLAPHEKKLWEWQARLQEFAYEWVELKEILGKQEESFLPNPGRLEAVLERLDALQKLKRKYGGSVEEILQYSKERRERLAALESVEDDLKEAEQGLLEARASLESLSDRLSQRRKESARGLSEEMKKEFAILALPHGSFEVSFEETESWSASGKDRVEFRVGLNPGEPLLPLKKVASGGELSRILLALRSILAFDPVPTLVFDEIDAALGGEAAFHVSDRLQLLARKRQVLCVTHLHQVASAADQHFLVEKWVENGKTIVGAKRLDNDGKVRELARMMGGTRTTEALLTHARELLLASQSKKNSKRHP